MKISTLEETSNEEIKNINLIRRILRTGRLSTNRPDGIKSLACTLSITSDCKCALAIGSVPESASMWRLEKLTLASGGDGQCTVERRALVGCPSTELAGIVNLRSSGEAMGCLAISACNLVIGAFRCGF
jgi:hypothetical protein